MPSAEVKCYPNPFSNQTTIEFNLDESEFVILSIFNITGKLVENIVSEKLQKGDHKFQWNAEGLKEGLYLILLETNTKISTDKAILLK